MSCFDFNELVVHLNCHKSADTALILFNESKRLMIMLNEINFKML